MSVVVPTRNRAAYLEVALESILSQRLDEPFEVVVVDDASTDHTCAVARAAGARVVQPKRRGLNAARNAAFGETASPLVAFVDDDVLAPPGWLAALVRGARRYRDADVLGGPIRPRFEGPAPRSCGRDASPITALDLGPADREAPVAWGANFAVRRSAWERFGAFPEDVLVGEEEEWIAALRAHGGKVMYIADAGLEHRRAGDDARLRSLARSAYGRGRGVRAFDVRRGAAPGLRRELRVLAGCGWHTVRRGCPHGLIMGAHSLGRVVEALRPR